MTTRNKRGVLSKDTRLILVLTINVAMVLGLGLVGIFAHSLGVVAAGADYLGDAAGAGLALAALKIDRRRDHSRATEFAALVNAGFLLLVTVVVAIEAIRRLANGTPAIHGAPVLVISVIAAGAMVACAFILGDVEGELGMQSVMLDSLADAAAAAGVAVSGAIILITHGHYWLDSAFALVIASAVGYHAIKLLRKIRTRHRRSPGPAEL